ncbi:hypothetical protein ACFLEY_03890 [Bradyrhizobium sp. YCK136]|uniref:hypothetical protein n=1 Tax=Bradyrhizobium sp. YCK136 TaxID=3351346 RepID=UPI0037CB6D8B
MERQIDCTFFKALAGTTQNATHSAGGLPLSLDRYGRTVATFQVRGADLREWLVEPP